MIRSGTSNRLHWDALTPSALILERVAAFQEGDFPFIYASYHPDAPFLQVFPQQQEYLDYAARELAGNFAILACSILAQRAPTVDETQVLLVLELLVRGERQTSLELARVRRTPQGWRFHSATRRPLESGLEAVREPGFELFEPLDEEPFF
ncbi:YchJ family metal-binding protein [Desulfuromonas sp. CSMB_57]|jgi:uncharacterized protein YchJ|uniref:YchJ family metal-binding protein n=1 Tax=Desulfuromonas sp. CSMB_57 TaxID=2807629 RepID=UPI001CD75D5D|nr:YchJ family metal-binding protein [Desulfuromonas sp. CSMB_57]